MRSRFASGVRLKALAAVALSLAMLAGCASLHTAAPTPGHGHYGEAVKLPMAAAFAPDGRLWRVVLTEDHAYVDSSTDQGRTFSAPLALNAERMPMRAKSEYRPQIAVDAAGRITVAYPAYGLQPWTTYVSVSGEGGKHFSPPQPLSDAAKTANAFQAVLAIDPQNRVHAFWHDERDAASEATGNAIFHNTLDATGRPAGPDRKVVDGVCSCCRLAVDFDSDGAPVVLTRFIYPGGIRDHALLKPGPNGGDWSASRATADEWKIDACPVHGPALAIGADGRYHIAWFTQGKQRQGVFYAQSSDRGQHFSEPVTLGDPGRLPGHPDLLSLGQRLVLVWQEFDGQKNRVQVRQSRDGGQTWSATATLAEAASDADYPVLLSDGRGIFLSWNSQSEGYRLIRIE